MDKDSAYSLFVNDGSFMEKFKQLQQEKQEKESPREVTKSSMPSGSSVPLRMITTNTFLSKKPLDIKANDMKKPSTSTSGGKLAFSLKNKSKVALAPVKLGADEDELEEDAENGHNEVSTKRQKLGQLDASGASSGHGDGRRLKDNFLLVHEGLFVARRSRKPHLMCKLDFNKAYDTLHWNCLWNVLKVRDQIHQAGYYVDADITDRKLEKKVREAQLAQYNYILVVGEKEANSGQVSVRVRDGVDYKVMSLDALLLHFKDEVAAFH